MLTWSPLKKDPHVLYGRSTFSSLKPFISCITYVSASLDAQCHGGQKRTLVLLQLALQMVVRHPCGGLAVPQTLTWVTGSLNVVLICVSLITSQVAHVFMFTECLYFIL